MNQTTEIEQKLTSLDHFDGCLIGIRDLCIKKKKYVDKMRWCWMSFKRGRERREENRGDEGEKD